MTKAPKVSQNDVEQFVYRIIKENFKQNPEEEDVKKAAKKITRELAAVYEKDRTHKEAHG